MKIVVTHPMNPSLEQKQRLEKLGEVTYYADRPKTPEEWLERCQGFDVICTGVSGFREKYMELHDVFVSLPFVGVGWLDMAVLKANNITVSYSPGCNRHAVSEWIIGMLVLMMRQLDRYLNIEELPAGYSLPITASLAYKDMTVLGKGDIGSRVGTIAKALEMSVAYFQRGDNLQESTKKADVVIDTLSLNPSTEGLLDQKFFHGLKDGTVFISITNGSIVDIDAMINALDSGKLSCVAMDGNGIPPADTHDPSYRRLLKHPKIYVTPHIAYNSDVERKIGNDMMIDNIEAWLKGEPIHKVG